MFAQNKLDPDDFFEALFDESFWSTLADKTNHYAHSKKCSLGNDMFEQLEKNSLSIYLQIVKIKLNICHAKYLFCRQVSL